MNTLSTPEKLLILAHHPDKARFRIPEIHLKYGLTGALLLELAVQESIVFEDNKLFPTGKGTHSDPLLAGFYEKIASMKPPRNIRFWIRRLSQHSNHYKWQLLNGLEKRRIIRVERMKFLGVIPYKKSTLLNKKIQYDLIRETRSSAVQQGEISSQQLAILGLVDACKMHKIISGERAERKIISRRLKVISKESPIASGVDLTIRQVHAAIGGVVAASGAAAAATSH